MTDLEAILFTALVSTLVSGMVTFLALRVGIEHRLTRLETELQALRPMQEFMQEHGQRTLRDSFRKRWNP